MLMVNTCYLSLNVSIICQLTKKEVNKKLKINKISKIKGVDKWDFIVIQE